MIATIKMQKIISMILLTGTVLAAVLVIMGGSMLLWQHGHITLKAELLTQSTRSSGLIELRQILHHELSIGLIELGLLCLVMTQVIRIALLSWFYAVTHDIAYTFISLFILGVLIYSTLLQ